MMARSKVFSTGETGLLVSVAIAALGLTWGCGGVPSQATLDDAAKARVQAAHDREKQFMEKVMSKTTRRKSGRLSAADLKGD
jgi:hypothetical protein